MFFLKLLGVGILLAGGIWVLVMLEDLVGSGERRRMVERMRREKRAELERRGEKPPEP